MPETKTINDEREHESGRQGVSRARIQSLIFVTGFAFASFLLVGSLTTDRLVAISVRLGEEFKPDELMRFYLSNQGLLLLVPWDVFMLAYISCLILLVITFRLLAEAQRHLEENPKRAEALTDKAENYVEWALTGAVFFSSMEFLSTVFLLRFVFFSGNVWPYLAISLGLALCVRLVMDRITKM